MKFQIKPIVMSLFVAGLFNMPVLAASNESLEASVARLQKEMASLKKQMSAKHTYRASRVAHQQVGQNVPEQTTPGAPPIYVPPYSNGNINYLPFDPDVPGRAFVTTGPYAGVTIQFAGTDLIINSPSVNTDLQLLDIRKQILNQLSTTNYKHTGDHSHLLFSGVIEGQANYTRLGKNTGNGRSVSDIDVTNVSLDATVFGPSDWILGFIEFSYDGSAPIHSIFESSSNYRVGNSRVLINKAFVTIGNLTCSPFYGTFGQYYVPYGTYSTVMVSDTLTKLLGRTKARAITLGFQERSANSIYASAYVFHGDSHTGNTYTINNGGVNFGYKFSKGIFSGNIGGGIIGNIADSAGMQLGSNFQEYEHISHSVPGYDLRASLSFGKHIDIISEYIFTTKKFNTEDLSYKCHGAKVRAFDIQAAYSFPILDNKPSSIGIGYDKSWDALGMQALPLSRTFIVFNTSLLRNTLQSLEFRRDREYAASATATNAGNQSVSSQSGKNDYGVTAQFDYYF